MICKGIRLIKKKFPEIGVMCDVALDPYTSHGHDGVIINKKIPIVKCLKKVTFKAFVLKSKDSQKYSQKIPKRILKRFRKTEHMPNSVVPLLNGGQ